MKFARIALVLTFKISLQMRESRVDQFSIKVNFIGLMR